MQTAKSIVAYSVLVIFVLLIFINFWSGAQQNPISFLDSSEGCLQLSVNGGIRANVILDSLTLDADDMIIVNLYNMDSETPTAVTVSIQTNVKLYQTQEVQPLREHNFYFWVPHSYDQTDYTLLIEADDLLRVALSCVPVAHLADEFPDYDQDGVLNAEDNCVYIENPDQADGWGTAAGDVCETEFYDSQNGVSIFPQKDNSLMVWGNCLDNQCQPVAFIGADALRRNDMTAPLSIDDNTTGWFVELVSLNSGQFQIQVFDDQQQLVDDGMVAWLNAEGGLEWTMPLKSRFYGGFVPLRWLEPDE